MELSISIIGCTIAIITTNIALISWIRSDTKSFEQEIRAWREQNHQEMKDFHGRLASIEARWHEEKYKKE